MDDNKHRVDLNIYGRSSGIGRFMRQQLVVWIANRLDFGNGWKWTDSKSFPPATRLDFQSFTVCFAVRCDASCGRGGRGGGGICISCETFVHVGFFFYFSFLSSRVVFIRCWQVSLFQKCSLSSEKVGKPSSNSSSSYNNKRSMLGGGGLKS